MPSAQYIKQHLRGDLTAPVGAKPGMGWVLMGRDAAVLLQCALRTALRCTLPTPFAGPELG